MKIDFVICWVDGNDPAWQTQRNRYSWQPLDESRYRDWDILKYWFRAVEAYAPWVNKIHFVTCGQHPRWLNWDHPKLHRVDHRDFIPEAYLPTFNSMAIELNLHRIEGLSEQFVYFNDDLFLNRPVTADDFFRDGLPMDTAVLTQLIPLAPGDPHVHAIGNNVAILNRHFNKKAVVRRHWRKWYTPLYGKQLLKNLLNAPGTKFSCFTLPHTASSMLRSTYEKVWALEPQALDTACREKFRASNGLNQYLMSQYNLCAGSFHPRSPKFSAYYQIGRDSQAMYQDLKQGDHKLLCLNDNADLTDFEKEKAALIRVLQEKFPDPCSFEVQPCDGK